ncbi:hypothetical protein [Novosphingobium rosa]|uniref:hypothetical protein n=1 Tax=Novosphingobium rosa TaxID=76978 RepID=UPI00082D7245|nr:hypothetical protein [Novosphingobium rosa]
MRTVLYLILWGLCSGYAILAGGRLERLGAAIFLWITAGSLLLLLLPFVTAHMDVNLGGTLIDGLATPACFYLALSTRRSWTLWFCAAQVVALLGHMVHYLLTGEAGLAYGIMTRVPSYIQCFALLAGTISFRHLRPAGNLKNSSSRP